jgi:hypothetical protein
MNSANPALAANGGHENWVPFLETAVREVFELMLGCHLTAPAIVEETTAEFTAMVGLAGQLCGVLSVRCHRKAAALMTSKMLGWNWKRSARSCRMRSAKSATWLRVTSRTRLLAWPRVVCSSLPRSSPAATIVCPPLPTSLPLTSACCLKACPSPFPCRSTVKSRRTNAVPASVILHDNRI